MNAAQEYFNVQSLTEQQLHNLKASLTGLTETVELLFTKTQRDIWEDRGRDKITETMIGLFRENGFCVADVYEFRSLWNSYEYKNLPETILNQIEEEMNSRRLAEQDSTEAPEEDGLSLSEEEEHEANKRLGEQAPDAAATPDEYEEYEEGVEKIAAEEMNELQRTVSELSEKYEAMKQQAEEAKQEAAEAKKRLEEGTPVRRANATERVEKLPTLQKLVQRYKDGQAKYQRFKDASTQQECKVILAAGETSFPTGNPKIAAAVTDLLEAQFQSYLANLAEEIAAMQI